MAVEVRIPTLGESITEGTIVRWAKNDGETIARDEVLLELETDKASMEIAAEASGVVRIVKEVGTTVAVGEVVARIEEGVAGAAKPSEQATPSPAPAAVAKQETPAAPRPSAPPAEPASAARPAGRAVGPLSPAVRTLIEEHELDPGAIQASGRGGRLTKAD